MSRLDRLREEWNERQQRLGSTPRAVLFKRFPGWLNAWIHRRHLLFVLANLPAGAQSLLDAGCGYGRISSGVKRRFPAMRFQGIDLSEGFSSAYEADVGPCFCGPIQEFETSERYDAILIVTLLMYLEGTEQGPILERLWSFLRPEGRLIIIEPAVEILHLWRRLTGRQFAAPTGGAVQHFDRAELGRLLLRLPGAALTDTLSLRLVPWVPQTCFHHGVAVERHAVPDSTEAIPT